MNRRLIIVSFIIILATQKISGQSQLVNDLEKKALEYLIQTYSYQNFDSCYKNWHEIAYESTVEIYNEKDIKIKNRVELIDSLKNDYRKFYSTNKGFKIIDIDSKAFDNKLNAVYFHYNYKEEINGKLQNAEDYIYFYYEKSESEWKILDFRITEVLGLPNKWRY